MPQSSRMPNISCLTLNVPRRARPINILPSFENLAARAKYALTAQVTIKLFKLSHLTPPLTCHITSHNLLCAQIQDPKTLYNFNRQGTPPLHLHPHIYNPTSIPIWDA